MTCRLSTDDDAHSATAAVAATSTCPSGRAYCRRAPPLLLLLLLPLRELPRKLLMHGGRVCALTPAPSPPARGERRPIGAYGDNGRLQARQQHEHQPLNGERGEAAKTHRASVLQPRHDDRFPQANSGQGRAKRTQREKHDEADCVSPSSSC